MTGAISAQLDLPRVLLYKDAIVRQAAVADVPISLVAAMGSRETRWDKTCGGKGAGPWLGDPYPPVYAKDRNGNATMTVLGYRSARGLVPTRGFRAVGPLQIDEGTDWDFCVDFKAGRKTVEEAIARGLEILNEKRRFVLDKRSPWSIEQQLRASIAAYNSGEGNVVRAADAGRDIDFYTAGGDYSKDVLERMAFFTGKI